MEFKVTVSVEEAGRKRPEYAINTDLDGTVSLADFLDFTKASLLITADAVLKEEQNLGFDKLPIVIVDGKVNVPVRNVNPLGTIEFVARVDISEIVLETYKAILERSPVDTGKYIKSNYVFLNGNQVANDLPSLEAWLSTNPDFQQSDFIRFVNIQPYARKLERLGVTAQRQQNRTVKSRDKRKQAQGIRVSAPNGVYFLTTRSIRAKYKRNSVIKFEFISGGNLGIVGSFKAKRGGKPGRPYLYPSITISVQESGTL